VHAPEAVIKWRGMRPQMGQTPLHIAALWGNLEAAEVLIKLGAEVNIQNSRQAPDRRHWRHPRRLQLHMYTQLIICRYACAALPAAHHAGVPRLFTLRLQPSRTRRTCASC
jgi:hypothetical protein